MSATKTPIMDLETDEDGWIGGSTQSIYAPKPQPSTHASPPPASPNSTHKLSPVTPGRQSSTSQDTSSRSLLERIDMAHALQQTPPPKTATDHQPDSNSTAKPASTPSPTSKAAVSPFRTTPSQGIRRPGAKLPSPLPLTSPARNNSSTSPLNTRTPLSASHPIPETPLKLSQRGGPQTPATPHYPAYPHSTPAQTGEAARASGLGLGLTPLKAPVPLAPSPDNVRSPLNEALNLRGRAASNASIGSPLKSGRSDLHSEPLGFGSHSSNNQGNAQIDAMLDRVRNTRSGLGTSASMWAPKPASSSATNDSSGSQASGSTTSHTIGSGFSSSNLLGVQTGLDRKRPSHRPNGLQLSLGQEISVMQELEERAEEDYPASTQSSATVAGSFRIDGPDHPAEYDDDGDWNGNVVPPTPALGCDSPSSDQDNGAHGKAPSRSLDAFGWGSHASNEPRKASLFSNLPSASTLEVNWSGDDDDEHKDDVQMFEDLQNRAKQSSKERRAHNLNPLPPPTIDYAKSRTPSPTHRMLAKSPQLDGPADHHLQKSPSLSAPKLGTSPSKSNAGALLANDQRPSPAIARSQLASDDSDGDADVENDRPKGTRERKVGKKHDTSSVAAGEEPKSDSLQVEPGTLEMKRSLKRDKSERIRGRRASQSKDKDVDKVKMSAAVEPSASTNANTTTAATVSLPTSTFAGKSSATTADELTRRLDKVALDQTKSDKPAAVSKATASDGCKVDVQQTPVANRVQSIPTIKDDLFSSPAEPKVGLPGQQSDPTLAEPGLVAAAAPTGAQTEGEKAKAKDSVPATPEPTHQKMASLDWAADDDELDDELPDLDDWGVTLSPSKPSAAPAAPAQVEKDKGTQKPGRNGTGKADSGGEDKTWRRAEGVTGKSRSKHAASNDHNTGARKVSGGHKGAARELFPSSAHKGGASNNADNGSLGIRIAGRAKSASLSPEPESAHAHAKLPPPARTPYGRWSSKEDVSAKAQPAGRPRIAADLGALAKLLTPVEEASAAPPRGPKAGATDRAKKGPNGAEDGAKKGPKATGSAAQSMHAPPSVADSLHAPPQAKAKSAPSAASAARGAAAGTGAGSGGGGGGKKKTHHGGKK
ncbi:hypothetical protein EX895_001729 [Sporisorium graminicola]|uniref:Uncharacterized protein n=1 Tax=Sporisorium graminicola TaxID=280036 RepID=A0A4U7L0D2_9BASI|nr:hypothetical protein EX895_001729 [Sporisorium graminicola]TKY89198.1 hypothetical protein EX895_001729 [Sporisorium graminicola]